MLGCSTCEGRVEVCWRIVDKAGHKAVIKPFFNIVHAWRQKIQRKYVLKPVLSVTWFHSSWYENSVGEIVKSVPINKSDCSFTVRCMMYGFGDDQNPYTESVDILEDLVIEFITEMTHKTMPMEDKVENELKILSAWFKRTWGSLRELKTCLLWTKRWNDLEKHLTKQMMVLDTLLYSVKFHYFLWKPYITTSFCT